MKLAVLSDGSKLPAWKQVATCPVCGTAYIARWNYPAKKWQRACSKQCWYKILSVERQGAKSTSWKGDAVGYEALHDWVAKHYPKPDLCQRCKVRPPRDAANKTGKYLRDVTDWEWLCRKCHMESDGRLAKFVGFPRPPQVLQKKVYSFPRTSDYRGVYMDKRRGTWVAHIQVKSKKRHLGEYDSEEEAAIVYNVASQLFFGPSAYRNPV